MQTRPDEPRASLDHEPVPGDLAEFEAGTLDLATFDHQAHVRVAFHLVGRHPFDEALARFASALRRLAAGAGAPEKYHATITVAFLALVAERRARGGAMAWEEFAARNPDLLDRSCLLRWYDAATLGSDVARRTFVLPSRSGERGVAWGAAASGDAGTPNA